MLFVVILIMLMVIITFGLGLLVGLSISNIQGQIDIILRRLAETMERKADKPEIKKSEKATLLDPEDVVARAKWEQAEIMRKLNGRE